MAKSIIARRKGDEYQARVFWLELLKLRTSDIVDSVTFESEGLSFIDDVVVKYSIPYTDPLTGNKIDCKYIQCKYHMTAGGAFSSNDLMDPTFIHMKKSMLNKLYDGYCSLNGSNNSFLIYMRSNWHWHPDDPIASYLHEELIRNDFFTASPTSIVGRLRHSFIRHLNIDELELKQFLNRVRFSLGDNLTDLSRELEINLKLASMVPMNPDSSQIIYDDLAWKLFEQGRNTFNRNSFKELLREENLIILPSPNRSEISICSYPQIIRRPTDVQSKHLDITEYFNGRYIRNNQLWNTLIKSRINTFLFTDSFPYLPQPIYLSFDCHLSIAYFIGHLINPKYGIQIIPIHKSRRFGYEEWTPSSHKTQQLWDIESSGIITDEVIICISVTNPLYNHLEPFLHLEKLNNLPKIIIKTLNGIGAEAVKNGEHAWQLGYELQTILRQTLPADCRIVHLFYSGPAALAYIIGNTLRNVVQEVQLYEHDYEGRENEMRYSKSISIKSTI
ncbi:MAG: SAVED domain-containing protein [Bacteroidota bacterium]